MVIYDCTKIKSLIDLYFNKGGEMVKVEEGVLGYGKIILFGIGLKTTIVNEIYLNEWSSGHTIRKYNKCPKKYKKIIEEHGGSLC